MWDRLVHILLLALWGDAVASVTVLAIVLTLGTVAVTLWRRSRSWRRRLRKHCDSTR